MLTSLIIREMQTKTTLRYHPTAVRRAIIKRTRDSKCGGGCGEKRALVHCWGECKLVQPLWKQYGGSLKCWKQNYRMTLQSHFWLYTQKKWIRFSKWYLLLHVHAILFTIAQLWKKPKCSSMDKWIKMMYYIYKVQPWKRRKYYDL